MTPPGWTIAPAGDAGLLIRFGDVITPAISDRVHVALAALDQGPSVDHAGGRPGWQAGWVDVMPGYASILIVFDPVKVAFADLAQEVGVRLAGCGDIGPGPDAGPPRVIEVPTLYHPDVAPDLSSLAVEKNLSVQALVALHTGARYRCQMLGFRPGFPFLRGLDPRLHAPRLSTPRLRVEAGSVGIGGAQTGIYPGAGPGGWRIIGRTPLRLFDATRPTAPWRDTGGSADAAFRIQPGDHVQFVPVDAARFSAIAAQELARTAAPR